jgi:hypothetical protein
MRARARQAMIDVIMDQRALRFCHGPFDGMELRGKIDAGPPLFDHVDDAAQMPLGALQPGGDCGMAWMGAIFWHLTEVIPRGGMTQESVGAKPRGAMTRGNVVSLTRIRALCACVTLALSLAAAPAIEGDKHGLGAVAAKADHRAYHAEQGHSHDIAGSDRHDSSDHDHVAAALLVVPGAEVPPPPAQTLRPDPLAADGTIRDGPRRPPRPGVT